jgi:hypothetical protein
MLCLLGPGCLQHEMDLNDTPPWQVPHAFVCHVSKSIENIVFEHTITEVYARLLTRGSRREAC